MIRTKAEFIGANDETRTYTFRASSPAVDRQGEVIDQAGWDLASYRANPVILDSHKYSSIDDIIGRATRVEVMPDGLEVDVQFADTDKGQMADRLVAEGFLKTVSVGFRSMQRRPGQRAGEPVTHTRMELLEVSMVAIPANRDAVRLRGLEDDVTDETKAGRRLSKNSEEKLRAAIMLLQELLGEEMTDPMMTEAAKPDEDVHMGGREPKKPKPKGLELDDNVVAALATFAKEATNG